MKTPNGVSENLNIVKRFNIEDTWCHSQITPHLLKTHAKSFEWSDDVAEAGSENSANEENLQCQTKDGERASFCVDLAKPPQYETDAAAQVTVNITSMIKP